MPCYHPLRAKLLTGAGGNSISFSSNSHGKPLSLPCGRCIGCRLERARQWAVRITHESKIAEENCFVTLTYDDAHLPKDGSLSVDDCQRFLKRLRKSLYPKKVRFFLCGEYGEKLGRPHYHAILFGYDPTDKIPLKTSREHTLYESPSLSQIWGKGSVILGAVTFDSAAYVANYATKKITGKPAAAHYRGLRPEFLLMSRRPGIGRRWFDSFCSDVFPSDEVISRGAACRPPRYYDNLYAQSNPVDAERIKIARKKKAQMLESFTLHGGRVVQVSPGNNARRLAAREICAIAKQNQKLRSLEKNS